MTSGPAETPLNELVDSALERMASGKWRMLLDSPEPTEGSASCPPRVAQEIARRALTASKEPIGVKALAWHGEATGSDFSAEFYYIRREHGRFYLYLLDAPQSDHGTSAEAKAAAQSGYEARIRAALSLSGDKP